MIKAMIVYLENDEVDEVVFTYSDVEQAKNEFENNITKAEHFYRAPDQTTDQSMALCILTDVKTIDWKTLRLKTHSLRKTVKTEMK